MKRLFSMLLTAMAASATFSNVYALTCQDLDGAYVFSYEANPVYLGFFGTPFATDSIMNKFGPYGDRFSQKSVRNEFGRYGSPFELYSATNRFTSTPPRIFKYGSFIGYLTTGLNSPRVSLEEIDRVCIQFSSVSPADQGSSALPPPPTQVNASDGTYTDKIVVTWSGVSAATAYKVYYSQTVSSAKTLLGQYAATSVNVTGTAPGAVLYFWVYSVNANGESAKGTYDTGSTSSSRFPINSGLNDAWFDPTMPGQGFFITVFPDIQMMFLAWFTYDTERPAANVGALLGEPGHRWLTAFGPYSADTAELDVELSQGGVFGLTEPAVVQTPYGKIRVVFSDCNTGTVDYDIPSAGVSGQIPIERIALDNVPYCEAQAAEGSGK